MASSFEKSVKGATKIKVSSNPIAISLLGNNNLLLLGCSSEDEIHRAHSDSYPFWRVRCRGGIPFTTEPPTRLNMDRSVQKSHHRAPDDKRGFSRCHIGFSGQAQEYACNKQLF